MNKDLQVSKIRGYLDQHDYDSELVDVFAEVDSSLSYQINLNHILFLIGYSEDPENCRLTPSEQMVAEGNYLAGFKECIFDAAEAGNPDAMDEIESKQLIRPIKNRYGILIEDKVKKTKPKKPRNLSPSSLIRKHRPAKTVMGKNYGAFDCETEGLYGRAKLICLVLNDGTEKIFKGDTCITDFIGEVTRQKYQGYKLYAHNLEFDLEKTFGEAFGNCLDNKDFKILSSGSRLIKATYVISKGHNLTLLDSINLMPGSLSSIGKVFGFPKLDTPKKWLSGEPVNEITAEDESYCIRDCKIVLKIIEFHKKMLAPFDVSLKLTTAANAKAIWRSIELKESGIFVDEYKDELFRDSYYGGRVEVFIRRYEEVKLYHYDVNSLYPAMMKDNKFPNPDKLKLSHNLDDVLYKNEGCAFITVEAPNMEYPILPYRNDDRLTFPVGTFSGCYNFPEIRYAIENGYKILNVKWIMSSEPIESPFKKYVQYFEAMKIKAHNDDKPALEKFAKLMLNSLYGKFGQRNDVEDRYVHKEPDEGIFYKQLSKDTYEINNVLKERSRETVVSWASYTTSYARVHLHTFFPGKGLRYCDTDSLFSTEPLPDTDVDDTEFGKMKLEDVCAKSNFGSPKYYAYQTDEGKRITRTKGLPISESNGIELKDFSMERTYKYDKVLKPRTALHLGEKAYSKQQVKKSIHFRNDKRVFDENGDSTPIIINDNNVANIPIMLSECIMTKRFKYL